MSTIAYEQFVIDNEILGMAMRAVRGIEVNEETLAIDVIDRVGPGNHFLMDKHTMRYMRTEHYFPSEFINRQGRHNWEKDGEIDARTRAQEIARHILAEYEPTPIDADVDVWIKERFASSLVLK